MNKQKHYEAPWLRYVILCLLSVFAIGLTTVAPGCGQTEPDIPSIIIPLDANLSKLALHQADLRPGLELGSPEEMDVNQLRNLISEIRELEELSPSIKDAMISYMSMLLDLGFNRSWKIADTGGLVAQELILFTSSSAAEKTMIELPQPTINLLSATFESLGAEVDGKLIDIDKSGLSSDSWGLYMSVKLGDIRIYQITAREGNLTSSITVGSSTSEISPYSVETADDALLLSRKAMSRIREQVAELEKQD